MTHYRWPILLLLPLAGLLLLGTSTVATADPEATIVAFSSQPGSGSITLGVAIPRHIDEAARSGKADWGLRLTVTYIDVNGAVGTLDSGPLSIQSNTVSLGPIDHHTDLIQTSLQFNSVPLPGNTPNFSGTAQLLHP